MSYDDREKFGAARYRTVGRLAMRRWLAREVGSDDLAAAEAALRNGVVDELVVRFWAIEDLIGDRRLESAACQGYPALVSEFQTLRRERDAQIQTAVREAVDAAFAEFLTEE